MLRSSQISTWTRKLIHGGLVVALGVGVGIPVAMSARTTPRGSAAGGAAGSSGGEAVLTGRTSNPDSGSPATTPSASSPSASGGDGSTSSTSSSTAKEKDKKVFYIAGEAPGLYPGGTSDLPVTISNPNNFPIVVRSIQTHVGNDTAHPGCSPGAHLDATEFSGAIAVPRDGTVTRSGILSVTMAPSAPDACQGTTFPLEFSGKATKENQ